MAIDPVFRSFGADFHRWPLFIPQVVMVASQELSVGRWADITVYLEDGRVVEAGRWDDLLASGGSFASAVREHDAF
ncbi:unnamed protein product [Scytosiphon promiscuus]